MARLPDGEGQSPPEWSPGLSEAYAQHTPDLCRFALMIVADHGLAQDAVHQAFLKVAGARIYDASVRSWPAYLRTAVRHECYRLLRLRPASKAQGPLLEPAAPGATEEERLLIEELLRSLPAEQREVVCLKVFEGFTLHQIAETTGVSINTVSSRYRYAMDKLRAAFGGSRGREQR